MSSLRRLAPPQSLSVQLEGGDQRGSKYSTCGPNPALHLPLSLLAPGVECNLHTASSLLQTAIKPDPKQASTSSGVTRPDAVDASAAAEGDDDLNLAWETAEVARVTLYQVAETDESAVSPEDLAEVHEILADISSERESFDDAITDFQQVRVTCVLA